MGDAVKKPEEDMRLVAPPVIEPDEVELGLRFCESNGFHAPRQRLERLEDLLHSAVVRWRGVVTGDEFTMDDEVFVSNLREALKRQEDRDGTAG